MSAVFAMKFKVEITLPGGEKIAHNAEAVLFVKECEHCHQELRTVDPRMVRHRSCKRAAARVRAALKRD